MFYCREDELRKLNKRYENGRFECIVIYGRRRVGKTALINEFCKGKKVVYYSALNATSQENLRALSTAIYQYKNPDASSAPEYRSFDDAFAEITHMASDERLVFVIDEYPYLAKSLSSISSRLQHLMDHAWGDSKLYLILCGSSMSFMEYQVLGYESPLYGRRTAQFRIEPLTYRETALFNPALTCDQNALVYGITGGIPHYINKLDVHTNIDEALLENLFDRSSYLFEEPENLLKQELREPAVYNSIITAIAEGSSKLNDISTKAGIESGPCSKYVKTLMELGIITKETPVTEKAGKKTIYRISDNFFRFWYCYVPQNIAAINSGRVQRLYDRAIKSDFSHYMGAIFEKMCREYLMRYAENLPFALNTVGRWWGNSAQLSMNGDGGKKESRQIEIDIVAPTDNGKELLVGSCKYRNEQVGMKELLLMQDYAAVFGKAKKIHYYLFSKSGFTQGLKDMEAKGEVTLVTLEDMYEGISC